MYIDAHTHIGVRHAVSQSPAELVAKLDAAGVDRAVVFPFPEGNYTNETVVEAVKEFPERLIPFGVVDPWKMTEATDELERIAKLGFKGLKIHPTLHGYHLADLKLVGPVLEIVRAYKMVLISHGAGDIFNPPPEFGILASAFQEVPILMAHSGIFWSQEQAIQIANEHPNLYLETARVPVFEIRNEVNQLGAEKVIWGTDAPFVDYTWEFQKMRQTVKTDEEHDLVCGGNLERLLNL